MIARLKTSDDYTPSKRRNRLYRHSLHRYPTGDTQAQLQTIIHQLDRLIDDFEGDADDE